MKRSILILACLLFTLITSAQTILSNEISLFSGIYEKIDFYNEDGSTIVSLAPRFYRQRELKKWIKPIKVNDQNYLIKCRNRNGVQSVYTSSGEHVANLERDGTQIHLVQDGSMYTLKPRIRLANLNILECRNSEGSLVSTITWTNDKKLTFENMSGQNPNLILFSLCAHQFQELLLGDRGRLSSNFISMNTLVLLN